MGKKNGPGLWDLLFDPGHDSNKQKKNWNKHTNPRAGTSHAPGYKSGGDRKGDVNRRHNRK